MKQVSHKKHPFIKHPSVTNAASVVPFNEAQWTWYGTEMPHIASERQGEADMLVSI